MYINKNKIWLNNQRKSPRLNLTTIKYKQFYAERQKKRKSLKINNTEPPLGVAV